MINFDALDFVSVTLRSDKFILMLSRRLHLHFNASSLAITTYFNSYFLCFFEALLLMLQ